MSRWQKKEAKYIYLSDIVDGGNVLQDENNPFETKVITRNNENIEEVRFLGTIVSKFYKPSAEDKKTYIFMVIDDGTAAVKLKSWDEQAEILNNFQRGEVLDVIGSVKEYNDERYILPTSFFKVEDPNRELFLRTLRVKRYTKQGLSDIYRQLMKKKTTQMRIIKMMFGR